MVPLHGTPRLEACLTGGIRDATQLRLCLTLSTLNPFDWFLVAIVLYSTVVAFVHGFFREIFSLVGLVAGILLASWKLSLARRSAHPMDSVDDGADRGVPADCDPGDGAVRYCRKDAEQHGEEHRARVL